MDYGYPSYTPQYFNPTPGRQYGQVNPYQGLQPPQPAQPQMTCRPVASIDEAKAIPTDFTGSTQVFTDFAHGNIYTKTLNYQTGAADFKVYTFVPDTPAVQPTPDYVPRKEFDALRNLVDTLKQQIGGMTSEPEPNVSRRNAKPNGNDAK